MREYSRSYYGTCTPISNDKRATTLNATHQGVYAGCWRLMALTLCALSYGGLVSRKCMH